MIDSYQGYLNYLKVEHIPKQSLLLHACCACCSSEVLEELKNHFDITLLYYNPNTYPKEEYDLRFLQFAKLGDYKVINIPYNHQEFLDIAKGLEQEKEGGSRCYKCYLLRLEETAKIAKEKGFDLFSTTLSISPYKNSDWLNEIGIKLASKYKIDYLYSNFKKNEGYKKSIVLAKKYKLYRQDYCGCEFSLEDKKK